MKRWENNSSARRSEARIPVCIRAEEAMCDTIVLQDFDGLSVRIHRSLLPDNHIEVCEKEFALIPESLYDAWFGREWKALKEKEQAWNWYYYKTHIGFLWQHREQILAEPRYAQVPTPLSVYLVPDRFVRLGILLQAWVERPDNYMQTCKRCGGTMVVYSFAGSPMSGRSSRSLCCVDCGLHIMHDDSGNFNGMMFPIRRLTEYNAPQPDSEPLTLEALVAELSAGME